MCWSIQNIYVVLSSENYFLHESIFWEKLVAFAYLSATRKRQNDSNSWLEYNNHCNIIILCSWKANSSLVLSWIEAYILQMVSYLKLSTFVDYCISISGIYGHRAYFLSWTPALPFYPRCGISVHPVANCHRRTLWQIWFTVLQKNSTYLVSQRELIRVVVIQNT